jgi:hypothetical protein
MAGITRQELDPSIKNLLVSTDFTFTKTSAGYEIRPDGLIEQWGYYNSTSVAANTLATFTITLPMAFPGSDRAPLASLQPSITNDFNLMGVYANGSNSDIKVIVKNGATAQAFNIFYRAFGY